MFAARRATAPAWGGSVGVALVFGWRRPLKAEGPQAKALAQAAQGAGNPKTRKPENPKTRV